MKERLIRFFCLWLAILAVMVLFKVIFFVIEPVYHVSDLAELLPVIGHGLPMDFAMSGYLMLIPGLILVASVVTRRPILKSISIGHLWLVAFLLGFTAVLDAALFPYWNFRLDSTPLFYFFTSPGAAMASLPIWAEGLILVLAVVVIYLIYRVLKRVWMPVPDDRPNRQVVSAVVLSLITAALIIPIRGGVTVSTMTTGRGFFSTDMKLNQATINPLFSLMYSLTHVDNLAGQFNFFDAGECDDYFNELFAGESADSVPDISLKTADPDIYLIILESFSAGLMPSLGGEAIAVNLDRIATEEGVLFSDFYAESFRTDRALPTILSGYPAMPTASVMRYTNKLGAMPGLARVLRDNGWNTTYYYGGDADFTNMRAYLVATGFGKIVSDSDFPVSDRLSKWGVHDGPLFERVIKDLPAGSRRQFTVIQTSSSHEPFEVPFSKFENKKKNAFAYTDECLGQFVKALKTSGMWENALVVIVPDHWGAYPEGLEDYKARHHVPFVLTGGVLSGVPAICDRPSSQRDIAPTILGLLGIDSDEFIFSTDIFDRKSPSFGWIAEPDWFGVIDKNGATVVTLDGDVLTAPEGVEDTGKAKAFVQKIYEDFDKR